MECRNKILNNLTATALSVLLASAMSVSCTNRKNSEENTPGACVECFMRAIACGDFESASSLADSTANMGYVSKFRKAFEQSASQDSTATGIAAAILGKADIEIIEEKKDGPDRKVNFRITFDGKSKDKAATVRKEEGKWKITQITDAI